MIKKHHKKGFTLVELLVVIAIIAILVTALFLVINPSEMLKKSRDSKRFTDLVSLNNAISLAYAERKITFGSVVVEERSSCTSTSSPDTYKVDGSGWVGGWTGSLGDYINALPRDPVNKPSINCYFFGMSANGTWELNSIIESASNIDMAINDGGNSGNPSNCDPDNLPHSGCRYEIGTDLEIL